MPKRYAERVIGERGEANLARRIERLRTERGWSYETLAKAMTDAGCAISKAAVYSIERGDPPRRITVDELVALSEVFDRSVSDLLTPLDLVDQQRAAELLDSLRKGNRGLYELTSEISQDVASLAALSQSESDIYNFVMGHFLRDPWGGDADTETAPKDDDEEGDGATAAYVFLLTDEANRYWRTVVSITLMYMNTLLAQERGEGPADEQLAAWVTEWEARKFSTPGPGEERAKLIARIEEWVERMRSANGIDQEAP